MYKLESDVTNPDRGLNVKFYQNFEKLEFQSNLEQRDISESRDFIQITIPGDPHNVVDTIVNDDHKRRFPLHWAAYKNMAGDSQVIGTPLSRWSRLTPSMVEELKSMKFLTVETIAHASDSHLKTIGMVAGQSAFSLRDDAKRFLAVASDNSKVKQAEEHAAKIEAESLAREERHNKEIKYLKDQMATLIAALGGDDKKKPGRPPRHEDN